VYPHYLLIEAVSGSEDGRLQREVEQLLGQAGGCGADLGCNGGAESRRRPQRCGTCARAFPMRRSQKVCRSSTTCRCRFIWCRSLSKKRVASSKLKVPGIRVVAFGHVGDGNVHFNLSQPIDMERAQYARHRDRLSHLVHELAMSMGGSFSAEHGIGQLKRDELRRYRSEVELQVMRKIKAALDPSGLMNPGKVL
jgi:FAD/FMN-containing dehydrogenase